MAFPLPEDPSTAQILAQYDKLGGPVKLEGRKIAIGAFWDFANKVARKNVKIDDLEYEDEYVLTRKPKKEKVEGPSLKTRLAQVKKAEGQTTEDDEPSAGPSKKKEEAPEVEAPKEEAPKAEAEAPKPKAKKASKKAK